MPETKECPLGVENRTRIDGLERIVGEIKGDVKDIKDRLLKRPSWFVSILITAMASAIVFLVMELAKQ